MQLHAPPGNPGLGNRTVHHRLRAWPLPSRLALPVAVLAHVTMPGGGCTLAGCRTYRPASASHRGLNSYIGSNKRQLTNRANNRG